MVSGILQRQPVGNITGRCVLVVTNVWLPASNTTQPWASWVLIFSAFLILITTKKYVNAWNATSASRHRGWKFSKRWHIFLCSARDLFVWGFFAFFLDSNWEVVFCWEGAPRWKTERITNGTFAHKCYEANATGEKSNRNFYICSHGNWHRFFIFFSLFLNFKTFYICFCKTFENSEIFYRKRAILFLFRCRAKISQTIRAICAKHVGNHLRTNFHKSKNPSSKTFLQFVVLFCHMRCPLFQFKSFLQQLPCIQMFAAIHVWSIHREFRITTQVQKEQEPGGQVYNLQEGHVLSFLSRRADKSFNKAAWLCCAYCSGPEAFGTQEENVSFGGSSKRPRPLLLTPGTTKSLRYLKRCASGKRAQEKFSAKLWSREIHTLGWAHLLIKNTLAGLPVRLKGQRITFLSSSAPSPGKLLPSAKNKKWAHSLWNWWQVLAFFHFWIQTLSFSGWVFFSLTVIVSQSFLIDMGEKGLRISTQERVKPEE